MDALLGAVRGGLDCLIVADGLGFLGYVVLVDATAPRFKLGEFFRHAVDCSGGLRERERERSSDAPTSGSATRAK